MRLRLSQPPAGIGLGLRLSLAIRGNRFGKIFDIKQSERNLKSDKHEILSVDQHLNVEASKAPPDIKGTAYDHLAPETRFPKLVTVKRNNSMPVSYRSKHRYVVFWHERAAFQRSSFGRSRSGGRLLAMT